MWTKHHLGVSQASGAEDALQGAASECDGLTGGKGGEVGRRGIEYIHCRKYFQGKKGPVS